MSIQKLKAVLAGAFTRTAVFIGIIAAGTGPFVLLAFGGRLTNKLPWYIWTITLLLLLLVMVGAYYRFTLDSHDAEDISISPKRR
ncbi:MAG: hypothetical protein AB1631_29250 [Acidobacteriota bacterium]